jgi:hypothetical protein
MEIYGLNLEGLFPLFVLAVWFVTMRFILPRLGVST